MIREFERRKPTSTMSFMTINIFFAKCFQIEKNCVILRCKSTTNRH